MDFDPVSVPAGNRTLDAAPADNPTAQLLGGLPPAAPAKPNKDPLSGLKYLNNLTSTVNIGVADTVSNDMMKLGEALIAALAVKHGDVVKSKYRIFPVSAPNLRVGSVAVALVEGPNAWVLPIFLEATLRDGQVPPEQSNLTDNSGAKLLAKRGLSHCWTQTYANALLEAAKHRTGGATVIPLSPSMLAEESVSEADRTLVLRQAFASLIAASQYSGTSNDFNLAAISDLGCTTHLSMVGGNPVDASLLPHRVDAAVGLRVASHSNVVNTDPNAADGLTATTLVRAGFYMDMVYTGAPANATAAQINQVLMPRVVYSWLETGDLPKTLANLLLGQAMLLGVRNVSHYGSVMRAMQGQRAAPNGVDPRNVGAINVLANINAEKNAAGQPTTPFGQVISTSGANGTPENIKMLLEAAMQSSTIFSVLCPMIGPDANLYTVLLHAVQGDAAAIAKINSAANVLTGGRFESVKPANVAPLLPRAEYLPMMVYRELNGGRLADASQQIDLLAALNLYGADDLAQLGKFTRLASEQTDAVAHQALRQTLVESVLGQETKIKGLSVLATWNPAWLAAFASCVPANLLEPENPAALQTSLGLGMAGWAPSNAVGFISGGAAFSQDSRGAPVPTHTGLGLSLVG